MSARHRQPMPACKVCGSSAPITRTHAQHGSVDLCYRHEYVCWPHLADPCPECDAAAESYARVVREHFTPGGGAR